MIRILQLLALGAVLGACATPPPRAASLLRPTDRAIIAEATAGALESAKSGETRSWEKLANGLLGDSTPLNSDGGGPGHPCRDFRQTLGYAGTTTTAYDRACRRADGTWASLNHPDLSGAIAQARLYETSYAPPTHDHSVVLAPTVTYGFYGHRGYGHGYHHGSHHGSYFRFGYYRPHYPHYYGFFGHRRHFGHHRRFHHRHGHRRGGHHRGKRSRRHAT